mgnify:CR=1 FL=1|jgi:hypothetical protein
MGCCTKMYFVIMRCLLLMDHSSMVDDTFCQVVGDEFCPYFLFDKVRLIRMEMDQSDGIFQFPK